MVENWRTVELESTWTSSEMGLIITCIVLYIPLLFGVFIILGWRIRATLTGKGSDPQYVNFLSLAHVSASGISLKWHFYVLRL